MRLAVRQGLLSTVPAFTLLKEAAPRAGFFERDAFEAVCRRLPEDLQLALRVEHTYGWRMQSEVLTRQWPHLDLGRRHAPPRRRGGEERRRRGWCI